MRCKCCGTGLGSSVLTVVGLVGLGVAGYNTLTTGCPLARCWERDAGAIVSPAALTGESSCASQAPCHEDATPACAEATEAAKTPDCGEHKPADAADDATPIVVTEGDDAEKSKTPG